MYIVIPRSTHIPNFKTKANNLLDYELFISSINFSPPYQQKGEHLNKQ
jgi:hypothetical protein